jgi:ankyrin repeat protein
MLLYASERGFDRLAKLAMSKSAPRPDELRAAAIGAAKGKPGASQIGRIAALELLRDAGVDFNRNDANVGGPLLYSAVQVPLNEDVIRHILTVQDVNPSQRDGCGDTALSEAVYSSRKVYVDILLAAGADPNMRLGGQGKLTVMLIRTVVVGDLGIFKALLSDSRTLLDAEETNGRTALSWCATVADVTALRMMLLLLENPLVDTNKRDKSGRTALGRTIASAQPSLVKAMLQREDTNPAMAVSRKGKSPLDLTVSLCRERNSPQVHKMARLLLDTGKVDPRARERNSGISSLERAKALGLMELVEIMEKVLGAVPFALATGRFATPDYTRGLSKSRY